MRRLRAQGLALRAIADKMTEAGMSISHQGAKKVLAAAVAEGCGVSKTIDSMDNEHIKAFIEAHTTAPRRRERNMAEASRRGRLLQSEPEKPLPDVPLHNRGFGVMDEDLP